MDCIIMHWSVKEGVTPDPIAGIRSIGCPSLSSLRKEALPYLHRLADATDATLCMGIKTIFSGQMGTCVREAFMVPELLPIQNLATVSHQLNLTWEEAWGLNKIPANHRVKLEESLYLVARDTFRRQLRETPNSIAMGTQSFSRLPNEGDKEFWARIIGICTAHRQCLMAPNALNELQAGILTPEEATFQYPGFYFEKV